MRENVCFKILHNPRRMFLFPTWKVLGVPVLCYCCKGIQQDGLPLLFGLLLGCAGVLPAAIRRRAFSADSRASLNETAGYLPIDNSFSFPSMRYFSRHNLPPAGVTCKNIPRRLPVCMAWRRAWHSLFGGRLVAFGGIFYRVFFRYPRIYPRFWLIQLDSILLR